MFDSPKIKVTYNSRLRRARVQFSVGECLKSRKPPASIFAKVEDKFFQEKEEGHIEFYEIFSKRFEDLWLHIRNEAANFEASKTIKFTLGQGGRRYEEIRLTARPTEDLPEILLNCHFSDKKMLNVSFNGFIFNLILKFRELKLDYKPDRAQLRFIYLLLQHGQPIKDMVLLPQPRLVDIHERGYIIRLDSHHRYASLHLVDRYSFLDSEAREKLWQRTSADIQKLNIQNLNLSYLKQHTLEKLASLSHKVQSLGFNLPYDLLVAYDEAYHLESSKLRADSDSAAQQHDLPHWQVRLGALRGRRGEYFEVKTDSSGMRAHISQVHVDRLDQVRDQIDVQWVILELQKSTINFGYESFLETLLAKIQQAHSLQGLKVAEGQPAQPGQLPILVLAREYSGDDHGSSPRDMRELQNPNMFLAGELVAEVRFSDGVSGRDVFGKEVHALGSATEAHFKAGPGIEIRNDCQFYTTRNGMISIDEGLVQCSEAYVHKGSVNLSSGNLYYEGAVVIQGDIEAGASVQVKGTLQVEGTIGPSHVRCSGDLFVKGGILTSLTGSLKVGGNIRCDFAENSIIEVRGDFVAQRSILNCYVIAGGHIQTVDAQRGLIAGASLSCWGSMRTARCGLAQGLSTVCRIGSNFLTEQRVTHLKQRLERLKEFHQTAERGLKEGRLASSGKSGQNAGLLAEMQRRVQRSSELLKKVTEAKDNAERQMTWNSKSTLMVSGPLDRSVQVFAAGRFIAVPDSLSGVIIVTAPVKGSYIVDIQELASLRQAQPEVLIPEPPAKKK